MKRSFISNLPMLLMIAAPYIFLGCVLSYLFAPSVTLPIIGIALFLMIFLLNLSCPFLIFRSFSDEGYFLFWNMLIKLCHIPVFIVVFAIALIGNIMIIPLLPFLFLFDCLLLLSSTLYGLRGIQLARQNGIFFKSESILHTALHFFFCADVFSSIYCFLKMRRSYAADI